MLNESTLTFGDRDEFKREQIAARVITLLTSDIDLTPMVIDGDWGTGKTEFCHKLINKFKSQHVDHRVLYIDAFQADHADNPLMTVLSSVLSLLPEGAEKSNLKEKAIPVIRFVSGVVAKAVTSHVLKQNADDLGENLEDVLQESANQAIDASVKALLKDHEKSQKNIQALRDCLETIAESKPIVIFVDELDRCRPDFSVQLLEVIKHTFNTNNVKFVLITNTIQLKAAINHRYGTSVNAQRYLDKFFKFSLRLPEFIPESKALPNELESAAVAHFSNLIQKSGILKSNPLFPKNSEVEKFSKSLIAINNLSLREVETIARHLEIHLTSSDLSNSSRPFSYHLLEIFAVFIFCLRPDITESVRRNRTSAQQIASFFDMESLDSFSLAESRWRHTARIGVLLALDCKIGRNEFISKSETEKLNWHETKKSYFENNWGDVPDDLFICVHNAINRLQLCGK